MHDIEEKYIEGQPQVSSVPVLPDEEGALISGLDTTVCELYAKQTRHRGNVRYNTTQPDHG